MYHLYDFLSIFQLISNYLLEWKNLRVHKLAYFTPSLVIQSAHLTIQSHVSASKSLQDRTAATSPAVFHVTHPTTLSVFQLHCSSKPLKTQSSFSPRALHMQPYQSPTSFLHFLGILLSTLQILSLVGIFNRTCSYQIYSLCSLFQVRVDFIFFHINYYNF